jgi:hypothetical protein
MLFLKQSTAVNLKIGPFYKVSDVTLPQNTLTMPASAVMLSKADGSVAQKSESSSCSYDTAGYYTCSLNTTDTGTLGRLQLSVALSGAVPVYHEYMVITANVWNMYCSTGNFAGSVESVNTVTGSVSGSIGSLASGAITSSSFSSGAIDAAAIAADAIGSSELATTAVTEIVNAILAAAYEGAFTIQDFLRLTSAVLLNKSTGGNTGTVNFRDASDTKNRIVATMDDNNNRTAITKDAS